MKHFETSGLWYPADDPDNAVGGTLKFDEKGLQLSLLGAFRQGWSPAETDDYPIIHGVVGDSLHGRFVTLLDSFRTAQRITEVGATSEKIRCHLALVGSFHLSENRLSFQRLELGYSYLTEWVGQGGMMLDQKRLEGGISIAATYTTPEKVQFTFGDRTLTSCFRVEFSRSTHKITLTERARLLVEPLGDVTPTTLVQEHVRTLQDLLTFATDRPNEVDEIACWGNDEHGGPAAKLNLIYDPIFRLEDRKEFLHETDMLFTFADCQKAGINIFQKWLEFSQKHSVFCEAYFGYTYAEPKYLDDRFKNLMVAFTLFCSTLKNASETSLLFLADVAAALKTHFSEDERKFMDNLVPSRSEVEMPIQLHRLLAENSDLMGEVIDDIPTFVRAVADTLEYIAKRERGSQSALEAGKLHYTVEKIKMLIKIVVLQELEFEQEFVKILVERNKQLSNLKFV